MTNSGLFFLTLCAVVAGWILGWLGRPRASSGKGQEPFPHYYKGLNHLINAEPDKAIQAFISSLKVNDQTFETHQVIGNLLRRRGEVDQAIAIRHNLLEQPHLPDPLMDQVRLELARDFMSAGLLDRAERLFLELSDRSSAMRQPCLLYLAEIYQDERQWEQAVQITRRLGGTITDRSSVRKVSLCHCYSELAQEAMEHGSDLEARRYLRQATQASDRGPRPLLLLAMLEQRLGRYRQAIRILHRLRSQHPTFIHETLPLARRCYLALGDQQGLAGYLQECLDQNPSEALITTFFEEGLEDCCNRSGELLERLRNTPSLTSLYRLLELHIQSSKDETSRKPLLGLRDAMIPIMRKEVRYQCNHCGFSASQLFWRCPSCKGWDTVRHLGAYASKI